MAYIAVLIVGIIIGWVIFERPQWATDAVVWFKSKLSGLFNRSSSS